MWRTLVKTARYLGQAIMSLSLLGFSASWFLNGPTPETLMLGTFGFLCLGVTMVINKWLKA